MNQHDLSSVTSHVSSINSSNKINSHLLLIDDHQLFRSGVLLALQTFNKTIFATESDSIASAKTILENSTHNIDLILLDQSLPDGEGINLLQHIKNHYSSIPVVILSASDDIALMKQALQLGASGYIPKSSNTSVIVSAIQLILSGGIYIPPKLMPSALASDNHAITSPINQSVEPLTERQQQVLKLVCQGLSNKEIAWQLKIAEGTVKGHISLILKSRSMHSRKQLIVSAQ